MPRHKQLRADWGSVTEVEKGKRYRLRYWATKDGTYQRCSDTVRGTRKQAYDRLAELRVTHTSDAPSPTLRQCYEWWWLPKAQKRVEDGDLAPSTMRVYEGVWRNHVGSRWGNAPIESIRPLSLQEWVDGMQRVAAMRAVQVISQTLDLAVRYERIDRNVARVGITLPSASTTHSRDVSIWSLDELGTISRAMEGDWMEAAYILAAYGSCRVGESLGARVDDLTMRRVDGVDVAVVAINKQITDAHALSHTLKNPQSVRSVVIPGAHALRLKAIADASADGWLTSSGVLGYAWSTQVRKEWASVLSRDGLPDFHPLKQLRPSWETYMRWSLHVPPWMTEKMMGHIGEGVTGRHYDKPDVELFVQTVVAAYKARPY
jgi:hypothetical protein